MILTMLATVFPDFVLASQRENLLGEKMASSCFGYKYGRVYVGWLRVVILNLDQKEARKGKLIPIRA